MDLSTIGGGAVDPGRLTTAVGDVFGSQGGIDGLLGKLRAGGLGPQVDSWVSTGSNEPVEPQQLGSALGPDTVNQLSAKSGLSVEMLLPLLAQFLPLIIDHLSPNGKVPAGNAGEQPDLGDLIGGLLRGR